MPSKIRNCEVETVNSIFMFVSTLAILVTNELLMFLLP